MMKKIISNLILFIYIISLSLNIFASTDAAKSTVNTSTSQLLEKSIISGNDCVMKTEILDDGTVKAYEVQENGKIKVYLYNTLRTKNELETLNNKKKDDTVSTVRQQREALIATAEAYHNQGKQLQYDSYKKNLTATPEDATSKHPVYTVCSGLVYMSYAQALEIDEEFIKTTLKSTTTIMDYAKALDEMNSPYAIFYYDTAGEIYKDCNNKTLGLGTGREQVTQEEKEAFIEKLLDNPKGVLPGDIFVYASYTDEEKTKMKGHSMLVHSVDKKNNKIYLIEAGGEELESKEGRYNVSKHEDRIESKGATAIGVDFADRLYANKDKMCLIRIIPKGDSEESKAGYKITDSAVMRMRYPDIDIGKIITNVDDQSYASVGDKLTFQVTVRNQGDTPYKNVIRGTEYIDSRLNISNIRVYSSINGQDIKGTKVDEKTWKIKSNYSGWGEIKVIAQKNGNNLVWQVEPSTKVINGEEKTRSLLIGDTVKIKYDVTIPANIALGEDKIIEFKGIVKEVEGRGCIATSKIETLIGETLSDTDKTKIKNALNTIKEATGVDSGRAFINELYYKTLGINLGISRVNNSDLIEFNESLGKPTNTVVDAKGNEKTGLTAKYTAVNIEHKAMQYLYSNFYGLSLANKELASLAYLDPYITEEEILEESGFESKASLSWNAFTKSELQDRARTLTPSMLDDGDVILTYTKNSTNEEYSDKAYIFLDNTLYRYRKDGAKKYFEEITDTETDKDLTNFLNNLIGENYIILRPHK